MSIVAIILFFVALGTLYFARDFLYKKIFPKLFGLKFLLIGFVIIGILFSIFYLLIDQALHYNGGQPLFSKNFDFNRPLSDRYLDYLYFSFISQLTIGYGDITPISPFGKVLTILQGLLGAVFMGGLVAALLNLSRETLNYLYIKSVKFHHCSVEANHGTELFNMQLSLYKTEGSVFHDFVVELIVQYASGKEFLIMRPEVVETEVSATMNYPLARKDAYPRFCEANGRLAFKTFPTGEKNLTPKGYVGKAEVFDIPKLILRYRYTFESRRFQKEVEITNLEELGSLLVTPGRADSNEINYK